MSDCENRKTFVAIVAQYTGRLVSVGAIVWLGVMVAGNVNAFKPLFGTRELAAIQSIFTSEFSNVLPTATGCWSFADSEFSVQRSRCGNDEIDRRLSGVHTIDGTNTEWLPDASGLVAVAKASGAVAYDCAAGTVWMADNDEMRLRLVTSAVNEAGDNPLLVAAVFAVGNENGWQLTTIKPHQYLSEHLLPLPDSVNVICRRHSEEGRLQMEIVETSRSSETILDLWRSGGWSLQRTPWGVDGSFSYLCTRDDQAVYVWSETETGQRTLLLSSARGSSVQPSVTSTKQHSTTTRGLARMAWSQRENKQ